MKHLKTCRNNFTLSRKLLSRLFVSKNCFFNLLFFKQYKMKVVLAYVKHEPNLIIAFRRKFKSNKKQMCDSKKKKSLEGILANEETVNSKLRLAEYEYCFE